MPGSGFQRLFWSDWLKGSLALFFSLFRSFFFFFFGCGMCWLDCWNNPKTKKKKKGKKEKWMPKTLPINHSRKAACVVILPALINSSLLSTFLITCSRCKDKAHILNRNFICSYCILSKSNVDLTAFMYRTVCKMFSSLLGASTVGFWKYIMKPYTQLSTLPFVLFCKHICICSHCRYSL